MHSKKNLSTTYIDYDFGQVHTLPTEGASQCKLEQCTAFLVKIVSTEGPAQCGSIPRLNVCKLLLAKKKNVCKNKLLHFCSNFELKYLIKAYDR